MTQHDVVTGRPGLSAVGQIRTAARVSDRVYDELVAAIRDLRLPPGTSLSETELAAQLHVSRTPLREAIARLADNRLVTVIPQVGTRVALIDLNAVRDARFVREALEVAAFEAACGIPERDLEPLRALLAEQARCERRDDFAAFFEADEALHAQIFAIGGYPGVWQTLHRMKIQLDRLRRLSSEVHMVLRTLLDEHQAIVDALEAGDVRTGTAHIRHHAQRVLEYSPALRERHPDYFTAAPGSKETR